MLSAFGASGLGFHFGLTPRASMFQWACLFFGLGEWAYAPIFQTPSVAPQPLCTVCMARAITFLVLGVISTCQLGAGLVRALSPSYVL